ncbi:unnamed protein product [Diabrotica balteata]|uniref:Transcriptional regulator ATRX n=1 Tax=Diabrotica balteata TaxID=107213 RepID=A0A9P0DT74_DIABA|nr:unnamed protein product [Diabrotica balteata]
MNQQEKIAKLKQVFSKTLTDLLTISLHTQNVCTELINDLQNENFSMISADAESLGDTLAKILRMLKGNSTVFVDTLLSEFHSINSQRPANFFAQMFSTLLECKHNAVINRDGMFSFAEHVDRDIQTDSIQEENRSNIDIQAPIASTSNYKISEETNDNTNQVKKECDFDTASNLIVLKFEEDLDESIPGKLSLRRQDTSDTTHTNESWMDTLQRSQDSSKPTSEKSNRRNSDENMVVLIKDENEVSDDFYSVPTQKIVRKTSTPLPIAKSLLQPNTLPVDVEMEDKNAKSTQEISTPKRNKEDVKNQNNLKQKNENSISNISNDQLHENLPSTSSCKSPEHKIKINSSDDINNRTEERYLNIDSVDKVTTEDFEKIMKSPTNFNKRSTTDELMEGITFEEYFNSHLDDDTIKNSSVEIVSEDKKEDNTSQECTIGNENGSVVNDPVQSAQLPLTSLTSEEKNIDNNSDISINSDDYYNVYSVETQPLSSDEENERNSERGEGNNSKKSPCDKFTAKESENYIDNDSSITSDPHIDDNFDSDTDHNVEGVPEEISNTRDSAAAGDDNNHQTTNKSFSDSDETDIEKSPVINDIVQLNVDNFSLENSNSRAESINSDISHTSFDFINNEELQKEETPGRNEISTHEVAHSAEEETQRNNEISTHEAAHSANEETPRNNEISTHEAAHSAKDQQNESNEDTLMDVDLEEYLTDCEGGNQSHNTSQDTICYYIKSDPDEPKEEEDVLLSEKTKSNIETSDKRTASDLGDELLELLNDQNFPDLVPNNDNTDKENYKEEADELLELLNEQNFPDLVPNNDSTDKEDDKEEADKDLDLLNNDNPDNENDEEEADKVLDLLNNDDSILSDSIIDSDTQSSFSDVNIPGLNGVSTVDSEEGDTSKDKKDDCYVLLERLPEKLLTKHKKSLNDNIDWLCDIENLSNIKKTIPPKKRRRPEVKKLTTIRHLISSSSDSDDANSEDNLRSSFNLDSDQLDKLDAVVADMIRKNLENGSDSESDSSSDSNESARKEKKKKKTPQDATVNEGKKEPLSKEELAKKAWRKDSLLRGKLSSSESNDSAASDSNDADQKPKNKTKRKRYEDDTEFGISSDHLNTDSDSDNAVAILESLKKTQISPIKQNIPDSDSDSDSDVQYISPVKKEDDEGDAFSPTQKGRRNIRSIQSDEILAVETQIAKKAELERIERLKGRSKLLESMSQSTPSETEKNPPLILDMEEKTNKILVKVSPHITNRLKPHQRKGIKFMWDSCYESLKRIKEHPGSGCILAHCMGLGKTFQVLSLIHTLFTHEEIDTKHVLVVCPLSTVNNWRKEVKFAYKGLRDQDDIHIYTFQTARDIKLKYDIVNKWHLREKSILIMGYEAFETITNEAKLDKNVSVEMKNKIVNALVDPGPDLVVCDEGHLIKNKKAVRAKALNKIKTNRRIVLTGTPLQNNLVEYYHMVHFVKPNLLGTLKEFRTNFVNPITNGQYEDSTSHDISLMRKRTHVLHKLLGETVQRVEDTELEMYLPKMLDYAVFIQLHQLQCDFYNDYCNRQPAADKTVSTFLKDVHMLQYIGAHPQLLNVIEASKNKKIKQQDVICEDDEIIDMGNWWKDKMPADAPEKLEYGHKMLVLMTILEECEEVGDKLLVFSQKIIEMDLIEHFLTKIGTKKCSSWRKKVDYFRMDGTVKPEERSFICDKFNDKNSKVKLLLMSVKVGGLGLNLTAANRVVIMTVNWNPSYDTQSIFRAYRFGQTKEVYVYRLIALGAMEEKIYQRTVTKLAIAHRVIDKHQIDRHYKSMDLMELYACRPSADNERPTPNVPEDKMLAKLILKLPCIYKYHEHKALLVDRHEEKLTEDEMAAAWEDFKTSNKKDLPPPPPPQILHQGVNGPTFEHAYNLFRSSLAQASTKNVQDQFNTLLQNYYMSDNSQFVKEIENKLRASPQLKKIFKEGDKIANVSISRQNVRKEKRTNNNITDNAPSISVQTEPNTIIIDDNNTPSTSTSKVVFSSTGNQRSSSIATNSAIKPSTSAAKVLFPSIANQGSSSIPSYIVQKMSEQKTWRNQIRQNNWGNSPNNPFNNAYKQYEQQMAKRKLQFDGSNISKKSRTSAVAQSSPNTELVSNRTLLESREREHISNELDKLTRHLLTGLHTRGLTVTETADKENEDQLNVSSTAPKKSSIDTRRDSVNIVSLSNNGSIQVEDLTKNHEEHLNSGQNAKKKTQNLNRREETVSKNDDIIVLL